MTTILKVKVGIQTDHLYLSRPPPFCLVFVQLLSLNHIVFSGTVIKYVAVFCGVDVCYFYGLLTTPCRGKTITDSMGGFRTENDHAIDK